MDLRSIAQAGVDPGSGRYLSPQERKAAFMKGMGRKSSMDPSKFLSSGTASTRKGPGGKGSAIVKRVDQSQNGPGRGGALAKQFDEFPIIKELRLVNKSAEKLFRLRSERVRLESKFANARKKSDSRKKSIEEEQNQESKKPSTGKNLFQKIADKTVQKVGLDLFGLLQSIITYGILDWISKPENKNQVHLMVKGFMGLFKFFDWFITLAVDKTLGGFFKLFGGSSILERMFGFFEMIFGVFLFRGFLSRLFNPLKLIGDIKWVIKNSGKFVDLFKALSKGNLKKAFDGLKSIFPKTLSIFKQGFGRAAKRLFLKIFGKGIAKLIGPLLTKATQFLVRPLAAGVKGVPIIGSLLAIPINMFLGDPIDKAAVKAIGSGLGTFVVGALGSIVPGAGTVLGAIAGGLLGDFLAGWLYDSVLAPLGKSLFGGGKKNNPQLSTGGIAQGPESGYPVTLHGTEAVIPISKFAEISLLPIKTVASILIGSTMAVLKSFGKVGAFIAPIALQMFNPFIRIFGITTQTFASGIGKIAEQGMNIFTSPASAKESGAPEDYLSQGTGKTTGGKGSKPEDKPTGPTSTLVPEGGLKGLTDADWKELAYIVSGEAGPGDDRYGVAAAVLNRVASSAWPNTIKAVGSQSGQFEAVYTGKARYDQKLADDLKNNQGKVAAALKKLNGRDSFKGVSQYANMGPGDVKFDARGNFYHYRQQQGKNDPPPSSPDQSWKKWVQSAASGGVINPVPSQNIATNKGGYAADTGLDILTPVGSRVVSPVSGVLEYAERGHVAQMGQDANPNMPGMQDQHSVRIRLDKPFTFAGKTVNFFYATHLYQLNNAIANKSNIKVSPGDLLGLSGVANNVPHTHVGFVGDRAQNTFLNFTQVKSLLSGAPVKDAGQSAGSPDGPSGSDSSPSDQKKEEEKPYTVSDTDINAIKELYTLLNPGATSSQIDMIGGSGAFSNLPDMSKTFAMGMKMDQIVGGMVNQPVIIAAPTNMVATAFSNVNLNSSTISETANLYKI